LSQALPESVASVTVIPDSAIGSIISSVDACLLGADSIFANGSFVNKTGSHLITMAAYNANVPVYVLCDSSKIRHRSQVPSEDAAQSEFFDANFSPDSNKNIQQQIDSKRLNFFNPMFEITPKYENVKFISEAGIVSGSEITQLAKKIEDTWKYLEEG
jgi:translation initiation factor 2B subunit (eIF-2B alpha/beta/delta family)